MIRVWNDFATTLAETVAEVVLAFQALTRYHIRLVISEELQGLHFPEWLATWIAFHLPDWVIEEFRE